MRVHGHGEERPLALRLELVGDVLAEEPCEVERLALRLLHVGCEERGLGELVRLLAGPLLARLLCRGEQGQRHAVLFGEVQLNALCGGVQRDCSVRWGLCAFVCIHVCVCVCVTMYIYV